MKKQRTASGESKAVEDHEDASEADPPYVLRFPTRADAHYDGQDFSCFFLLYGGDRTNSWVTTSTAEIIATAPDVISLAPDFHILIFEDERDWQDEEGFYREDEYDRGTQNWSLVRWRLKDVSPIATAEDFEKMTRIPSYVILSFNVNEEQAKAFEEWAVKNQDFVCASATDPLILELATKKYNVEIGDGPTWLLISHGNYPSPCTYSPLEFEISGLERFFNDNIHIPFRGEWKKATTPVLFYFGKWLKFERKSLAREIFAWFGDKIHVETEIKLSFEELAIEFGYREHLPPYCVIYERDSNHKYGIDQELYPEGPSFPVVLQFIEDYLAGKLKRVFKTEQLREDRLKDLEKRVAPVIKLFGHTFPSMVEDTSKDLFVYFHCSDCEPTFPALKILAKLYRSDEKDAQVLVTSFNKSLNECLVEVGEGKCPHLLLFPANGEIDESTGWRKPKKLEGAHEVSDMVRFITEEGGTSYSVPEPYPVITKVTSDTFSDFVDRLPLVLVKFGSSDGLDEEVKVVAKEIMENHQDLRVCEIGLDEVSISQRYGVTGPSLRLISSPKFYIHSMTSERQLKEFAANIEGPYVVQLNGSVKNTITTLTLRVTDRYFTRYLVVENPTLAAAVAQRYPYLEIGSGPTWLMIHPKFPDETRLLRPESFTAANLRRLIDLEICPYFPHIWDVLRRSLLPVAIYVHDNAADVEAVREDFVKLAKEFKRKMVFCHATIKDASLLPGLYPSSEWLPTFGIKDEYRGKFLDSRLYSQTRDFEMVREQVKGYFAGALIRSEPLPTEEEYANSPVVKLVGKNHGKVLEDMSKSFIVYYSEEGEEPPKCWTELAQHYGSHSPDSKVIVATADGGRNNFRVKYSFAMGFATLLYPANGKIDEKTGLRIPKSYWGDEDLESFIKFIDSGGVMTEDGEDEHDRMATYDD
ncbi:hypothetical protein DICA4_E04478 [Diutina catenulata]